MKTAVIQFNAAQDKEKNIQRALFFVGKAIARGAKFILLPEVFHFRGQADPRRGYGDIAERIPGASLRPLMEMARRNKVSILAGSICEKISGDKRASNTSALINSRGHIEALYRKIHLFSAVIGKKKVDETQFFRPGRRGVVAKVGEWKAGLSICYDLRFPGLYQEYARQGANILCVPSSFTKVTGQAHWEILLRARAIENFCYVLAPNQTGEDGKGVASYGNSMIIDPWGKILVRASGDKEEILFADLDKHALKGKRKILGIQKA